MRVLIPVAALALLAGSAVAQERVVVRDGEKTYTVEVVSTDTAANTLTIRTEKGPSTLIVEDRAISSLKTVKPGDKITIAVRNEATGQRQAVTAIVSGTMSIRPAEPAAEKTVVLKESGTAVEFLNIDPATRKITVIGDTGERQVFLVEEKAMLSLSEVKPGQKVILSYRFDRDGKPEAVVRVVPAVATPTVKIESGSSFEVVSVDPSAKTLTILNEKGESQTLVVDDRAVVSLKDLKTGEAILVTLEGDKVVVISRKK